MAKLFLSHKDINSNDTVTYLEKFKNFQNTISIISIHDNKELTRTLGIKKVPCLILDNKIYEGTSECNKQIQKILVSQNFNIKKEENANIDKDDMFAPVNQPPPMFADIKEPELEKSNSDYNNDIDKYRAFTPSY